jgi:hypothetical protein
MDEQERQRELLEDGRRWAMRRLWFGIGAWALVALAAGAVSLGTYWDAQQQAAVDGSASYYLWWGPAALAAWKIAGRVRVMWTIRRTTRAATDELAGS